MRIFVDVKEAFEEVKRDLAEMGIEVRPKSMQDKIVEGNPDYYTKELQNYSYQILSVVPEDVPNVSQPWADAEFKERIHDPILDCCKCPKLKDLCGVHELCPTEFINPGEAYKLRPEVWDEYLHDGKFAYSYNERIWQNDQLDKIMERLKEDPDSRQLWLSIWDPNRDTDKLGGQSRVPCSLGYNFQVREGKLNIHYVMRSNDYATHMANDVYLAMRLLQYVSEHTGYPVGSFTHTIFSLHVYNKDIQNVF